MTNITRRTAIFSSTALVAASSTACNNESPSPRITFQHGVASGDPTPKSIIIWTRITPKMAEFTSPISVKWEFSDFEDFRKIIKRGRATTSPIKDYTVKIDATGLRSGQTYYFRFIVGNVTSPIGQTKTLPSGKLQSARFAIVSCSNYPFGFFNIYDYIAKQNHFDAVIHLGDYFYEYGHDGYGGDVGTKLGREHEPAHECIKLSDYRTRHAQYKGDHATQALHAAHPLICVWDDHETANDSWKAGAQNHNEGEGDWDARRASAMQAYYEWMPVRDPRVGKAREDLFRNYEFGDLLSLTAIETRLTARTQPLDYADHVSDFRTQEGVGNFIKNILHNPKREMLGDAQKSFISNALTRSKSKKLAWRLIANQVIMARTAMPDLSVYKGQDFIKEIEAIFPQINDYIAISPLGLPLNLDAWDGYPAARERFFQMMNTQGINDVLVLTGDTHENWVNTLHTDNGKAMGVELGVSGVTSPGAGAYFGEAASDYSTRLNDKNPEIFYHDNSHHSFIDLQLSHTSGRADFISVNTIYSPEYTVSTTKTVDLIKGENSVTLDE
ncbi:MAG: alkaline phosphatase [Robiginitomaculum sp.]|nr:MAG: alkaline phosphatase [Robiginitomaculum sp.]